MDVWGVVVGEVSNSAPPLGSQKMLGLSKAVSVAVSLCASAWFGGWGWGKFSGSFALLLHWSPRTSVSED